DTNYDVDCTEIPYCRFIDRSKTALTTTSQLTECMLSLDNFDGHVVVVRVVVVRKRSRMRIRKCQSTGRAVFETTAEHLNAVRSRQLADSQPPPPSPIRNQLVDEMSLEPNAISTLAKIQQFIANYRKMTLKESGCVEDPQDAIRKSRLRPEMNDCDAFSFGVLYVDGMPQIEDAARCLSASARSAPTAEQAA
ncbi:TPA: hypothetical protein N0F65_008015, partial [Lagenidium giganteum]